MNNVIPNIQDKVSICIICEGFEEYEYFKKLVNIGVFNHIYHINLVNAKSNGNIPARYQDRYMSNSYDIVLVFCDTDRKPYHDYNLIKEKIDKFHGKKISDKLIMFANPCTMQIILSHFSVVSLTSQSKKHNGHIIKKLTNINNYQAHEEQRKDLFNKVNKNNYNNMKQNLRSVSSDDVFTPSTNFLYFLSCLESNSITWIEIINKELEID